MTLRDEDEYVNEGLPWIADEVALIEQHARDQMSLREQTDLSFMLGRSINSVRRKIRQVRTGNVTIASSPLTSEQVNRLQEGVRKARETMRRNAENRRELRAQSETSILLKESRNPTISGKQAMICIQHAAMMAATAAEHPDLVDSAYAAAVEDFLNALDGIERGAVA